MRVAGIPPFEHPLFPPSPLQHAHTRTQVQGDHLLLLCLYQLWAGAGFSKEFVRAHGLDLRGMNFAKEVRRQLAGEREGE